MQSTAWHSKHLPPTCLTVATWKSVQSGRSQGHSKFGEQQVKMSLDQPGAASVITPGFTVSVIADRKLLHSHSSADQRCSNRSCEDLVCVIKESDSPCGNKIKESWHTDQNKAGRLHWMPAGRGKQSEFQFTYRNANFKIR